MTLLRMLAFKPAGSAAGNAAGGNKQVAGPARKPTTKKQQPAKLQASADTPANKWQEPDWGSLVGHLGLAGAARLLASNCAYLRREGQTVFLGLDPRSDSMLTKQRKDALAQRLSEYFGEQLQVDVSLGAAENETPLQEESRVADERLEQERQKLESDPNVQTLKTMFGAELKTDTIEIISGDKG